MSGNIPGEAVALEAAALALNWHNTKCTVPTSSFLDEARVALEAAAPHMLAQAWDEFMGGKWDPMQENPYRTRSKS